MAEKTKKQASKALTAMGLSVSDAVRAFLTRVAADQELPFDLKVPNQETRAAMAEARAMSRARFANAHELMKELATDGKR
jgi:DNA-damage-inducible protein J